jgi:hypothetical protein
MPMNARATGIPTAQPTMTGSFDLDSELVGVEAADAVDAAGGVIVDTMDSVMVLGPLLPEDTRVRIEVVGVGVGVVVVLSLLDDDSSEDDELSDGDEVGELPLSDTRPVMLARFGALFAVDCPMIAYC